MKKVAGILGCFRLLESKESAVFIDRCNCYLLEDRIIIDCGSSVRLTESNEVVVLLTHSHGDHSGAAHQYQQVRVHVNELENVQQGLDPDNVVESFTRDGVEYVVAPCPYATALEEGETFLDGSLRWMHTPGHSIGSVCYVWKELVLFTGDTLYDATFPTIIKGRSHASNWVKSLSKLKKLLESSTTIKYILGSHDRSTTPMTKKYAIDKIQRWSEFITVRSEQNTIACVVCNRTNVEFVCGKCEMVPYCGEICADLHWNHSHHTEDE